MATKNVKDEFKAKGFTLNNDGTIKEDTVSAKKNVTATGVTSNGFGFISMYVGQSFTVPTTKVLVHVEAEPKFVEVATVLVTTWVDEEDSTKTTEWTKIVLENGEFVSTNWLARKPIGKPVYDVLHESLYEDLKDKVISVSGHDELFDKYAGKSLTCVGYKVIVNGTIPTKYYAFALTEDVKDIDLDQARVAQSKEAEEVFASLMGDEE